MKWAPIFEEKKVASRKLKKLEINRIAIAALAQIRARVAASGLDKITPKQIIAEIKAARRARHRAKDCRHPQSR